MTALRSTFITLQKSLPSGPVAQEKLDKLVENALRKAEGKASAENRKSQWEYLVKNEVMKLAVTEGKALKAQDATYYSRLRVLLDLALTLAEHDAYDVTVPFTLIQDLFETQTIASCSHIFSWLEERAPRLTVGMVPQKGKALLLLRTLNDLLRRLSRTGSTTIFCGRIQTFLSVIYPLSERSGVNLRGEYGPTWEGVKDPRQPDKEEVKKEEDGKEEGAAAGEEGQDTKMQVDEDAEASKKEAEAAEKQADFYLTFWGLQLPFSKPPLFGKPSTFPEFKESVNKVFPVIKEAASKERAMMGSKGNAGHGSLKRKREADNLEESGVTEYFFAKFLTSPDLLDLEIADVHFRRQFLFQLLILLNYLLNFTKSAKEAWVTQRNQSLHMNFTLEPEDQKWVTEMIQKICDELRLTAPNGRGFLDSVNAVLERDKNWVRWKNEHCQAFDKDPWTTEVDGKKVGLWESGKDVRKRMREPPKDFEHKYGSEALTEIWEMGYRNLYDLENFFQPGDVQDYVKKIKFEDHKIAARKKQLAPKAPIRATTPPAAANATTDVKMASPKAEEAQSGAPKPGSTTSESRPAAPILNNSPLHPSLPAKPGSTSAPPTSVSSESAHLNPQAPSFVPRASTPAPPTPVLPKPKQPTDKIIAQLEEHKHQWAWLALRMARDQYLHLFAKIKTGDVGLLAQEIENEKNRPKERLSKEADEGSPGPMVSIDGPAAQTEPEPNETDNGPDVKMEEVMEEATKLQPEQASSEEAMAEAKAET